MSDLEDHNETSEMAPHQEINNKAQGKPIFKSFTGPTTQGTVHPHGQVNMEKPPLRNNYPGQQPSLYSHNYPEQQPSLNNYNYPGQQPSMYGHNYPGQPQNIQQNPSQGPYSSYQLTAEMPVAEGTKDENIEEKERMKKRKSNIPIRVICFILAFIEIIISFVSVESFLTNGQFDINSAICAIISLWCGITFAVAGGLKGFGVESGFARPLGILMAIFIRNGYCIFRLIVKLEIPLSMLFFLWSCAYGVVYLALTIQHIVPLLSKFAPFVWKITEEEQPKDDSPSNEESEQPKDVSSLV